ncbi:MAG: M20 family metallopeptidase [bacterium]|nr:M20 family metallopeptidase [bacterium]
MKTKVNVLSLVASFALAVVGGTVNPEYVKDMTELLSIPSVSTDVAQNDRATMWMKAFLERNGVWCAVETWPEDGRKVLYAATKPNLKNPDYTIVTHLDVVAAPPEQFVPRLVGTKIYARGADDTKVVAYAAAKILARLNGKASVGCIFSSNEEVGGKTTGFMVDKGYGVPGKMVFVFDGSRAVNSISYACKGCAYYKVTAKGKSGHASRPEACDNPIDKLAAAVLKIKAEYPFQKKGEWGNVAAVTIIGAGDSQNRIPEEASMTVNVRFVEDNGLETERKLLEKITGLDVELIRGTPAAVSRLDDAEFVRLRAAVKARTPGMELDLVRGKGANDSRYFPQFGKPMVGVGGISLGGAHSDNEWIDLATLDPQIEFMCDFILGESSR